MTTRPSLWTSTAPRAPSRAEHTQVRRVLGVLLGVTLGGLSASLALRWVDVASSVVAMGQSVVPVVGAGVVLVTAVASVCRFRQVAIAGLVPSVVAVGLAVSTVLPGEHTNDGVATSVTVMAANLELGQGDADDVLTAVRAHDVAVLVLVEVTPAAVSRLSARGLDTLLPASQGEAVVGAEGTLVRSRWPLTLLDAGVPVSGNGPRFGEPVVRVERPNDLGGAFEVRGVHSPPPVPFPGEWQAGLRRLGAWQRSQPSTSPLVMAGDFNASAGHPAYRLMSDGLVDAHHQLGEGWVRTWPMDRRYPPFVQLDHVLARGFRVQGAGVVPVRVSDHAAVWATLRG